MFTQKRSYQIIKCSANVQRIASYETFSESALSAHTAHIFRVVALCFLFLTRIAREGVPSRFTQNAILHTQWQNLFMEAYGTSSVTSSIDDRALKSSAPLRSDVHVWATLASSNNGTSSHIRSNSCGGRLEIFDLAV